MASASSESSSNTFSQARIISTVSFSALVDAAIGASDVGPPGRRHEISRLAAQSSFSGMPIGEIGCRRNSSIFRTMLSAAASIASERKVWPTGCVRCPRSRKRQIEFHLPRFARLVLAADVVQCCPRSPNRPAEAFLTALSRTNPARARSTSSSKTFGYSRSRTTAHASWLNRLRRAFCSSMPSLSLRAVPLRFGNAAMPTVSRLAACDSGRTAAKTFSRIAASDKARFSDNCDLIVHFHLTGGHFDQSDQRLGWRPFATSTYSK